LDFPKTYDPKELGMLKLGLVAIMIGVVLFYFATTRWLQWKLAPHGTRLPGEALDKRRYRERERMQMQERMALLQKEWDEIPDEHGSFQPPE
jgi:hypothetical protein